ncbi:GNAT family N-acetyltransferase [Pseudomonas sp. GD03842]|uniref:GNAT family N-acetyltransferase n=1 Tax=unclassified Pseudomonas TaxID=196821 RepID=UPI000D3C0C32|nr:MULTISPECIES: GNAT family N-acetyltransferase [unclassified Pseudomonas]MDH0747593.1 GNAT family N-acetyltransferase [Pseudomonas sp. GD03842]RAU49374.1 GNAT family N-acetyltransferase [Pseudomonas sp. RIT 409]RAU55886.1 GNAT family N-acetyltransferase [Pseudomonas sp. RIT 412]
MTHPSVIYLPKKHDYAELTRVWEASVRATHDFLPENYITLLRNLLETQYLDAVTLFCTRDSQLRITGFGGISPGKLEMLFIAPDCRGKGLGKKLLDHAIEHYRIRELDVNEQNPQALGFYQKQGFEIVGRSKVDGLGRPYPMLRMKLKSAR